MYVQSRSSIFNSLLIIFLKIYMCPVSFSESVNKSNSYSVLREYNNLRYQPSSTGSCKIFLQYVLVLVLTAYVNAQLNEGKCHIFPSLHIVRGPPGPPGPGPLVYPISAKLLLYCHGNSIYIYTPIETTYTTSHSPSHNCYIAESLACLIFE